MTKQNKRVPMIKSDRFGNHSNSYNNILSTYVDNYVIFDCYSQTLNDYCTIIGESPPFTDLNCQPFSCTDLKEVQTESTQTAQSAIHFDRLYWVHSDIANSLEPEWWSSDTIKMKQLLTIRPMPIDRFISGLSGIKCLVDSFSEPL